MAFGDYATLLSDFTGSDEDPLSEGGNWTNANTAALAGMQRLSNQAAHSGGDFASAFYWTPDTFGPDAEVYATVATASSADFLALRVTGAGGYNTWNGYLLQVGGTTWSIYDIPSPNPSRLIGSATASHNDGDKIGLTVTCWTLEAWQYTSGAWSKVLTCTDSQRAHSIGGHVIIGNDRSYGRLDDVYAGTIPRTDPCVDFVPTITRRNL